MLVFNKKYIVAITLLLAALAGFVCLSDASNKSLPLVAIANYGPHLSLDETIRGIKEELARQGFRENQEVRYAINDVGFEASLLMQMITKLKSLQPQVLVLITTPVAQAAKNLVKDIPLVFSVVTDPVEAGLLKNADRAENNITGASDKQDLRLVLHFVKQLLPQARTVGVLYTTSEANDTALVKMLEAAARQVNMQVMSIPIDQVRDIPLRMQAFKGQVDCIYVGASCAIQSAFPAIAAEATKMHIPLFNVSADEVRNQQALGSFGVDYHQIGINTAQIIAPIMRGECVANLPPSYPGSKDYRGFISRKQMHSFQVALPSSLNQITIVE
jgi:putative ABC transport system substrate-binding protein